jgi:hypothetical protein
MRVRAICVVFRIRALILYAAFHTSDSWPDEKSYIDHSNFIGLIDLFDYMKLL